MPTPHGERNPAWKGGKQPFICYHCGETFYQYPSNRPKPPYFCNRACHRVWKTTYTTVACEECGNPVDSKPCQPRRFCSRACSSAWRSRYHTRDAAPVWKGGIPERTCDECGDTYQPVSYPSQSGKRGQQRFFCSHTCQGEWQSKYRTGTRSPNWKGGYQNYYGPNWREQMRAARKRDGYKCHCCGKTQKQNKRALDVHHIQPFREFGYIPNVNDRYLLANDLANLISLCKHCHVKAEAGKIALQRYLL